ncbi:MAG: ABC-2 type transport system ATP-binding protein [Verrucomicrobiales bacterium]|jgi:ABC-2 type transport system ATP-binding protein
MIEVKNLSKFFGSKVAVDDVSFEVKKGEVLGFLGPNGAGKSTTMRMITGFIPPSSGSVVIDGLNMNENEIEAKSRIGYLPESAPLYNDMAVNDFLGFSAAMRGLDGAARDKAVEHAIELCFLQPVRRQSIDTLSKGYRHRTCLAQALIHDPDILVLDEPTDGLDPNQKHEVRQLLKRLGEEKAIIFSTHILEEVEAACTRAIIIDRGKVIANGTPNELKSRSAAAGSVRLRASGAGVANLCDDIEKLDLAKSATVESSEGESLSVVVHPKKKSSEALVTAIHELCVKKKLHVEALSTEEGKLDEVFRDLTTADTAA